MIDVIQGKKKSSPLDGFCGSQASLQKATSKTKEHLVTWLMILRNEVGRDEDIGE